MFDTLLKPKLYSKCKSRLKLIKIRLETIQKKRNAVQKFLKKDIVDLLRSSLYYNAYGRVEGLLVEQNMSSCYELIAKFASSVLAHLSHLCKQRDCPDECKEAISSLIYAAARFSDLPELRDLRTLFTEKYGNYLEPYISKEFVEKLRQDPPSKEMKIRLLQNLAQEFSIEWDSKALEQRLSSPPQLHEEKQKDDPLKEHDDVKWHKNNDVVVPKIDDSVPRDKQKDGRDSHKHGGSKIDTISQGRKAISDASLMLQSRTDDETTTEKSSLDGPSSLGNSSVSKDEVEIKKPFSYKFVPPPYVKENFNKGESNLKKTTTVSEAVAKKESNHDLHEPIVQNRPIPRSVRRRPLKSPIVDKSDGTKLAGKGDSKGDEEEREMERLLIHYSKKQSPYETVTVMGKGHNKSNSHVVALARGTSLPPEETSSVETLKRHGRATSFAPEMLRTGHVHPSLPDYEDLPARLAALRG